jgi:2'-5' RNA ligase
VRLFVALELPERVVAPLLAWAAPLGLREPAAPHVTLVFLGEAGEPGPVVDAVLPLAAPVGGLAARRPVLLGRGSALAVALDDGEGACAALQRTVAGALEAAGLHEPERRRFRPHVTVARVPRGASVPPLGTLAPLPEAAGAPFAATRLTVFSSVLSPRGARYAAVGSAPLTADAPGSGTADAAS